MTTEEKAKAYDALFVKAQLIYNKENDVLILHTIKDLFPELKESEDERIRKEMISYFKQINYDNAHTWNGINLNKFVAWLEKQGQTFTKKDVDDAYLKGVCDTKHELEKQGEQKPQRMISAGAKEAMYDKPAWSEDDEFELECVLCNLRNYLHEDSYIRYENWLKSLKDRVQPKQEWSEEDEELYDEIRDAIYYSDCVETAEDIENMKETLFKAANWIEERAKFIRPQNTWKPSDEQLVSLDGICSYIRNKADWEISQDMVSDLYKLSEQLKKLKD